MINKKTVLRIASAVLLSSATVPAAYSGVINSNVPFVTTNGSTHTDVVTGADVANFTANDSSSIAMSGGSVSHMNLNNSASANVSGGAIGFLNANDSSSAIVSGGTFSFLNLYDLSSATVTGGDLAWLNVYDSSFADVFNIVDLSWLVVGAHAQVNLHADNVSYSGGHLSGIWGNGNAFSFWAVGGEAGQPSTIPARLLPNIHIISTHVSVPEPVSALLFGAGFVGLLVARRGTQRN